MSWLDKMLNKPSDSAGKAFLAQQKKIEQHLKNMHKRKKLLEDRILEEKRNDECKEQIAQKQSQLQDELDLVTRQIAYLNDPANVAKFKKTLADRQAERVKNLKDQSDALKKAPSRNLEGVEDFYEF